MFTNYDSTIKDIKRALSHKNVSEQNIFLSQIVLRLETIPEDINPFSGEFKKRVLDMYKYMTGNEDYIAKDNELNSALESLDCFVQPIPYRFSDSKLVGEHLIAYGWIMMLCDVQAEDSILEYGCGEGQLIISFARIGCRCYVIDIDPNALKLVEKSAHAVGVKINTMVGTFNDSFEGKKFDRIIFYESFHHGLDHQNFVLQLKDQLKPDGYVVFAGEPIILADSVDACKIPYPWGLRLDGESIRSIMEFGWMELGFTEEYFVDLLIRSGFSVEKRDCLSCNRGSAYLAKPYEYEFPINNSLIKAYDGKSGWYEPEQTHRWTNGHAVLPVPIYKKYCKVSISITNFQPNIVNVEVKAGQRSKVKKLHPGERRAIYIDLSDTSEYIEIISDYMVPSEIMESDDERKLGVAIDRVSYE